MTCRPRVLHDMATAAGDTPAENGRGGVNGQMELLDVEAHRSLRMHATIAEHPPFVMITLNEFPAAAAVCPIFFGKDNATGEFYAGAMFGFRPGELLVDGADKGMPLFRPLELQRQGFFISDDNIAVDPAHARFGAGASVPLFEHDGQPSEPMRNVQRALGQLIAGVEATRAFIRELLELKLIEPIDINLRFDDGEKLKLDGLYTVSRDGLGELDDTQIVSLFRSGHLQAAYCMTFSLNQVAVLAQRRNDRL